MMLKDTTYLNQKWKKRNQVLVIHKRNQRNVKLILHFNKQFIKKQLHKIKDYYLNHFIHLKMVVLININNIFQEPLRMNRSNTNFIDYTSYTHSKMNWFEMCTHTCFFKCF